MRESVRQGFLDAVVEYEGRESVMYLDTRGLVTCGVGNLVDPVSLALELPWRRADGSPASAQEVEDEWQAIKGNSALARQGARAARALATLHLTEEAVDALVGRKLEEFWSHLAGYFPGAEDWPADAQLGLLLHGWAVGPHAHRRSWPRLSAALDACDWMAAAEHCVIPAARPVRNSAHQRCFTNAAAGADPELLFYPEGVV